MNLVDLDMTGFGNLVLMKLSAWHRARGDETRLNFPLGADRTYVACVFPWNAKRLAAYPADSLVVGGTGLALAARLPDEVEHTMPDYSLYGLGHSMGFTSRGCPRRCPWCLVPEKEGGIAAHADFREFWDRRHRAMVLLDNNLLAAPNWRETLEGLAGERLLVDFNQGLDIRLVDDERAFWLARVRARTLRFSFDLPGMAGLVRTSVRCLQKAGIPPSRLSFYVLVGFNTSFEEDRERFGLLRGLGCQAFPMFYRDPEGREHPPARGDGWFIMPHGSRRASKKYLRLAQGEWRA